VDHLIGELLNVLRTTGTREHTMVIMTADHGGKGKSHGEATIEELEIPWILNGPGIKVGHEIKTAVNTYDLAPTIAWVLGLRAPACWIGQPVMEAFQPAARKRD